MDRESLPELFPNETQRREWKSKILNAFWQGIRIEYRDEIEKGKLSLSTLTNEKVEKLFDLDNERKTFLDLDHILTHVNKTFLYPKWKDPADKNPLSDQILTFIEEQMQHYGKK